MPTSTTLRRNPLALLELSSDDTLSVHTAITLKTSNMSSQKSQAVEALSSNSNSREEISSPLRSLNQKYLESGEQRALEVNLASGVGLAVYKSTLNDRVKSEEDATIWDECKQKLAQLSMDVQGSIVLGSLKVSEVVCNENDSGSDLTSVSQVGSNNQNSSGSSSSLSKWKSLEKEEFEKNLGHALSLLTEHTRSELMKSFCKPLPESSLRKNHQITGAIMKFEDAIGTIKTKCNPENSQEPATVPAANDDHPLQEREQIKQQMLEYINNDKQCRNDLYECLRKALRQDDYISEPSIPT